MIGIGTGELLLIAILTVYLILLAYYVHDIVEREDLKSWEKTFWIVAIFVLSYLGILAYVAVKTIKYYRLGRREGEAQ